MEILPEQKALLQLVDADLEDSFSTGVTQAGAYLPALPKYDTLPPDQKQIGRKGILSTFAGLLTRLGSYLPSVNPIPLTAAFQQWPETSTTRGTGYSKNVIGEIELQGFARCVDASVSAYTTVGTLPPGSRPQKNLWIPAVKNGANTVMIITVDGVISISSGCVLDEWISFDGIRFRPA